MGLKAIILNRQTFGLTVAADPAATDVSGFVWNEKKPGSGWKKPGSGWNGTDLSAKGIGGRLVVRAANSSRRAVLLEFAALTTCLLVPVDFFWFSRETVSGSVIAAIKACGAICHDKPHWSLQQPH
jgi:hypothetical protein